MSKKVLATLFILFNINLYGLDIGCASSVIKSSAEECSQTNILKDKSSILDNLIEDKEKGVSSPKATIKKVKITEDLDSVNITFQKRDFLIERVAQKGCPPYCISPMKIAKIKTIGELETINFIRSLKKNRGRIVVDARTTVEYKKDTLPTAINIPYSMLSPKSKYRNEILKLLGVRKLQKKWYFKTVHKLLIFDNGILDNQATKIIKSLIKIGYPQNKILYYRGGVESWRRLGLTLF
jgi:rhodanese-related sulfurtransferase